MKGLIFRTFTDFVEQQMGDEMVEEMIDATNPESGGAYTTVGTYSHMELLNMVVYLSEKSGLPVKDLIIAYSHHLFGKLGNYHGEMVEKYKHPFDLLQELDSVIHVQVRKLYSDAELPRITIQDRNGEESMVVNYESSRPFADVAEGLIQAVCKHFNTEYNIEREDIKDNGTQARFTLSKAA